MSLKETLFTTPFAAWFTLVPADTYMSACLYYLENIYQSRGRWTITTTMPVTDVVTTLTYDP